MNRYLEEAAALLRKASEANEKPQFGEPIRSVRVELAKEFAMLAAIDKGLIPAEYADRIRDAYGSQELLDGAS